MSQWSEKQTSGCKEVRRAEVRRVVGRRQEWAWAPHTPSELSRHSRWGAPGAPALLTQMGESLPSDGWG